MSLTTTWAGFRRPWLDAQAGELRVVVDPMYGCDSARARRYLQAVFPRSLFSAIHDRPDPGFGDRVPDCTDPQNLEELAITVEHERADLGIALDGDGDRVAFVDNEGIVLTAEEAAWALIRSFGSQWPGRSLVYDLKFSKRLAQAAESLGALPIEEGSGYARVHAGCRTPVRDSARACGATTSSASWAATTMRCGPFAA